MTNWTTGAVSRAKFQSKMSPPTNQHRVFLQAGCPSHRPTNSVEALKGKSLERLVVIISALKYFFTQTKVR